MRFAPKAGYMALGGALTLSGFAAAYVVSAIAAPPADAPATFDAISVRDLRVVDADGETRVRLYVTPVDDPEGPIDVMRVRNAAGVVVHRLAIYDEGRGGGILGVRDQAGERIAEVTGGAIAARWGSGDGRTRATLRASRDGAQVVALGSGAEIYVGARPADGRTVSLRADHNGGVLTLANAYHQPRVGLRVGDDDVGVVSTLGK